MSFDPDLLESCKIYCNFVASKAEVVELVDIHVSGACAFTGMRVRVSPSVQTSQPSSWEVFYFDNFAPMQATKTILRQQFLEQRRRLPESNVNQLSQQIGFKLVQWLAVYETQYLHCFLPIQRFHEINTVSIINQIVDKFPEITILVPKVNSLTNQLDCYQWTPNTTLVASKWGVPEPTDAELFTNFDLIDCVITPLLAYDQQGYRVGYGKGFYDRFFAQCRADVLKVGVSFFDPVAAITDIEHHDVRLDCCVTPHKIWEFSDK